jgi:AraC-like DNA-binding protein
MNRGIYSSTKLKEDVAISEIVTVHYFEFSNDYKFRGEAHDFWELVYVDNGELVALAEDTEHKLSKGELILHKPGEWHTQRANGISAASAIIVSFFCQSNELSALAGRVFPLGLNERALLSEIINETENAFDSPLSALVTPKLHRRKEAPFGAEQLIKMALCKLMISLMRRESAPTGMPRKGLDDGLFAEIIEFLSNNLDKNLSLEEIARHAGISKTALKQLFSQKAGCGACKYYIRMKIDRAKTYIREGNYNFTQIAELLGYGSVHYFSAQFKTTVGMTPSEYASSIKALTSEAGLYCCYTTKNEAE